MYSPDVGMSTGGTCCCDSCGPAVASCEGATSFTEVSSFGSSGCEETSVVSCTTVTFSSTTSFLAARHAEKTHTALFNTVATVAGRRTTKNDKSFIKPFYDARPNWQATTRIAGRRMKMKINRKNRNSRKRPARQRTRQSLILATTTPVIH
jgi:hypothetical protein